MPNFTAYAIGTVIAGFLFALVPWSLGAVWNRFVPKRRFNPWSFPLAVEIFLLFVMVFGPTPEGQVDVQRWVISAGFVPALVFCSFRWKKYRSRPEKQSGL